MSAMLKKFTGKVEKHGEYEIDYLPESHFLEMGSAYGMYFPGAVQIFRTRSSDQTTEISIEILDRICSIIKIFCKKNSINLYEKYRSYRTTDIKFSVIQPDEHEQLCILLWADYHNVWIEFITVNHQTEYPDIRSTAYIFPAVLFKTARDKLKKLQAEYGYPENKLMYNEDEMSNFVGEK